MRRLLCFLLGHASATRELRAAASEQERAELFMALRERFRSWRPEGFCVRCGQRVAR